MPHTLEALESRLCLSVTDLDTTWANGGTVALPFQPDQRFVMPTGQVILVSDNGPRVAEVDADGTLLWNASLAGAVPGGIIVGADAAAVQSDGKVLLATEVSAGMNGTTAQLLRLDAADGSVDPTFTGGAFGQRGVETDTITDLAIEDDGSILICGEDVTAGDHTHVLAAWLYADGTLADRFDFHFYSHRDDSSSPHIAINFEQFGIVGLSHLGRDRLCIRQFNLADDSPDTNFASGGLLVTTLRLKPIYLGTNRGNDYIIGAVPASWDRSAPVAPYVVSVGYSGILGSADFNHGILATQTLDEFTGIIVDNANQIVVAGVAGGQPRLTVVDPLFYFTTEYTGSNLALDNADPSPFFAPTFDDHLYATAPDGLTLTRRAGVAITQPTDDTAAPTAAITGGRRIRTGDQSYTVTVTFTDDFAGIDTQTLAGANVYLAYGSRGRGHVLRGTLVSVDSTQTRVQTATYRLPAPGGTWGPEDAGVYTLWLTGGQVTDKDGNAAPAKVLGTIRIPGATPMLRRRE